jgi:Tfp pilus assembly protein PilF
MARFQTVLEQEPKNMEALLGLAEAYKNKGDKAHAVELFEKSKTLMNNPDFSRDIDNYIKSFN